MCFVMSGLFEETLKYLPIAYARRRGAAAQRKQRDRARIDYALAGTWSFGGIENTPVCACETGHETWAKLCLTVFERVVVGSMGHLLVAVLMALRTIGEKLS
jgi:RsiW-degrading membrane proteinase PrsW (M82 family)